MNYLIGIIGAAVTIASWRILYSGIQNSKSNLLNVEKFAELPVQTIGCLLATAFTILAFTGKPMIHLVGATFLTATIHGWIKNIKLMVTAKRSYTPTDRFLQYPLLFVWLIFMTAFSMGIMINN